MALDPVADKAGDECRDANRGCGDNTGDEDIEGENSGCDAETETDAGREWPGVNPVDPCPMEKTER